MRLKMRIEAHNCKIFQNKNIFIETKLSTIKKNLMIAKLKKNF